MKIIPAIDIRCGEFVVFVPNQEIKEKFQHHSPLEIALYWEAMGAEELYITDYDGLFKSSPQNLDAVREIKEKTGCKLYYSAGVSNGYDMGRAVEAGADFIIMNVSNIRNNLNQDPVFQAHQDKVVVGIDVKDSQLAVEGFNNPVNVDLPRKLELLRSWGLSRILVTDISKKGKGDKTFLKEVIALADSLGFSLMIAGGISSKEDIAGLSEAAGQPFVAAVMGRALYTGKIQYTKLQKGVIT